MEKHRLTAYPMNYNITCGENVNYYKSVHQSIPARENWEHPVNFQSESVSSAFFNEFCHFTL